MEVPVGGVGPWCTCGRKEWARLVFAIVEPEGEQTLERRRVFSETGLMNCVMKMKENKDLYRE